MGSKAPGAQRFDEYYHSLYQERWDSLKTAFLSEAVPVAISQGLSQNYYLDEGSLIAATFLPVEPGDARTGHVRRSGGKEPGPCE